MTLDGRKIGERGRVVRVTGERPDDGVRVRLMESGFVPGTEVRVTGSAPSGDPMEVRLAGYRLTLRRAEAARVVLE